MHVPLSFWTVKFPGQLIIGNSASFTDTLKLQVALFPDASTAKYETGVIPTGKTEPLVGPVICVIEAPLQLSVTPGDGQETTALHWPGELTALRIKGQFIITGLVLSITFTVNEHMEVRLAASIAL